MYGSPNFLAHLALYAWPVVCLALFATLPAQTACLIGLIAADLFLPAHFEIAARLDKDMVAVLSVLCACLLMRRGELRRWVPGPSYGWLFAIMLGGALVTNLTNREPIVVNGRPLPGETLRDFRQAATLLLGTWWAPFLLGRKLFHRPEHLRLLLRALALAALIYTPLLLFEVRMSPHLHQWVYGYQQSDFLQTIRFGGYRPKVFMRHGLNVGLFMCAATLAAVGLRRLRVPTGGLPPGLVVVWLLFVFVLCKSSGALFTFLALAPLLWAPARLRTRVATVVCAIVVLYPLLRLKGWFPASDLVEFFASTLGPDRAQSLEFRFDNETVLLARALDRPLFGWGGYGRQFWFDDYSGRMSTTPDGLWVLILGHSGLTQFGSVFLLLTLPIVRAARRLPGLLGADLALLSTGVLIGLAYVSDLIPNSGVTPPLTLLLGSLSTLAAGPGDPARAAPASRS